MDAGFLDQYDRELAYLRELGGEFAAQYPRVAGQLGLDEFACADPFVERLLEGFAFMSARVQQRMNHEFPQLTRAFLDTVFPHYARPIPATGIFQFQPDLKSSLLGEGFTIPKGSRLYAKIAPEMQTPCRFETTSDVQLWPLTLRNVEFFSHDATLNTDLPLAFHQPKVRSGIRFEIHSPSGIPIHEIPAQYLRLHLRGGGLAQGLYENFLAHRHSIFYNANGSWIQGDVNRISAHGFAPEDALLPGEPRSFSGYQLLQDYFLLPEKYLFVDIGGLRTAFKSTQGTSTTCAVAIGFENLDENLVGRISSDHLALHCVPAINLFRRRADRIHVKHSEEESHVVIDRSRPADFEVWSIDELTGHTASGSEIPFLPLYSPPTSKLNQNPTCYFSHQRRNRRPPTNQPAALARRRQSNYEGTEVFVTLTDSNTSPSRDSVQQLSAAVTCTNRDLALFPPSGGWREAFSLELSGPIASVTCIHGPTAPTPSFAHRDGDVVWRLISHLTPNYLSLLDNSAGGAGMLKEMLQLYCRPGDRSALRQTEGLISIQSQAAVKRLPIAGPITHGHGVHIDLHCDESAFEGGGIFLLGSVLERFFARFAALNSFTQTSLTSSTRGHVHRWPVRVGEQPML